MLHQGLKHCRDQRRGAQSKSGEKSGEGRKWRQTGGSLKERKDEKWVRKHVNTTETRKCEGEDRKESDKWGEPKGKEAAWCQVLCEGHYDVSLLLMTPTSVKLFRLLCWGRSSRWPHSMRASVSPDLVPIFWSKKKPHLRAPTQTLNASSLLEWSGLPEKSLMQFFQQMVPQSWLMRAGNVKNPDLQGWLRQSVIPRSFYSLLLFFSTFFSLTLDLLRLI